MKLSHSQKDKIVEDVRKALIEDFPELDAVNSCLYATVYMSFALRNRNIVALPQAGSMSWLFVDPKKDDGVSPNTFSFIWSPTEANSIGAMMAGNLPEMHFWVGLPQTQEIVDINTCYFPQWQAKYDIGDWSAKKPPKYFWGDSQALAKHCASYEPVHAAMLYGNQVIKHILSSNMDKIKKRFLS